MKRINRFWRCAASVAALGFLFQTSGCPIDTQTLVNTLNTTLNTELQTFITDLFKP